MANMSDFYWNKLLSLYQELSDVYFDVPDNETTQEERETLNSACESIMDVLIAHSNPEREDLLP